MNYLHCEKRAEKTKKKAANTNHSPLGWKIWVKVEAEPPDDCARRASRREFVFSGWGNSRKESFDR